MNHFKRYLGILSLASLIALSLGLSACGGGGSASSSSSTASSGTVSGSGK